MAKSFNSEHKSFIRENWNKPIIKFLSETTKNKLLYLGLPSPMAEDLQEWIDYINTVIAFQCRDYGKKSDKGQDRSAIDELEKLLIDLERKKKINTFQIYDGYLEEVVIRGYDNSPKQIDCSIGNFVTLYNLDFCNSVTNPVLFLNRHGEEETAYKFDAINRLLQFQQRNKKISDKFVLFLTINANYKSEELDQFTEKIEGGDIKKYVRGCNGLSRAEKSLRILRLFVISKLQEEFRVFGFTSKILPSLIYTGKGGTTQLLHFTVFGATGKIKASGVEQYQTLSSLLNEKFLSIDKNRFVNRVSPFGRESDVDVNPISSFIKSETYKKMWESKK